METPLTPQEYKSDLKPVWCTGCGSYGVLSALYKAMSICNLDPDKTVVVSGIGCSSRLPGFVATYGFHGLHGRALPIATGIKSARPDLNVIVVGGDGDGYSIGGGHFPHCARRNPDITCLIINNMTYGLTKGQVSPTSILPRASTEAVIDSKRWKTTPYGMVEEPINPMALAVAWGVSYVARGYRSSQLTDLLVGAIKHKGFALIDAFAACRTYNQEQTEDYYKELAYDLDADYDPTDRVRAFEKSLDTERLALGLIYVNENKSSLLDEQSYLRERYGSDGQRVDSLFPAYFA